jgi:hypothetical protein
LIGVDHLSRYSRWFFVSAMALVLAFTASAWAGEETVKKDDQAPPPSATMGPILPGGLSFARLTFQYQKGEVARYEVDMILKINVLLHSPDKTEKIRQHMVANKWKPDFIAQFVDAVRWIENLKSAGAERVYEEGEEYAAMKLVPIGNIQAEDRYEPFLADLLFGEAEKMGSKKAALDLVHERLSDSSGIIVSIGRQALWDMASEGFQDTRYEIATRYRDGNQFPEDKAMALYWFLMAREQGRNVDEEVAALSADLPAASVETIKTTIGERWELRLREDEKGRAFELGLEKVDPITTPEALEAALRDALGFTYKNFIDDKSPSGRAAVELRLRLTAAHNRSEMTKWIFDDMAAENSDPDFVQMFAEAMDWYEALKAGGAERLYEEANK